MSVGKTEQIENRIAQECRTCRKPWGIVRRSGKYIKTAKNRRERRRAKQNPECVSEYKCYSGWEF